MTASDHPVLPRSPRTRIGGSDRFTIARFHQKESAP
ncbi:hypothetical protein HNR23_001233 [Nocardiopsis mwathae]|uniref:Uncharacterized protein n=1 Tax=Nocardiopsis mwathae TaxID=1472723 RepID=A0A7W9YFE9_9ACTN|nr:hypothetical protein [Nocardiopsis mwathae]